MIQRPEHPADAELERFLRAEDEPTAADTIREHLLAGCLPCLLRARRSFGALQAEGLGLGLRTGEDTASWAERVALRADRRVALVEAERRVAPDLAEDLFALPRAERRMAVARAPGGMERFRLYGLAEHLTTTARRQAIGAGPEAVETADLAVGVAECLEPGAYSQGLVRDAQALAWASLGNARRVCGELEAADRALAIARDRLEHGTGEPMARADVLSLSGALRIEQRRFDEANSLLEEACSIFRDCGRPRLEGKVMINQSRSAYENGDCERSVVLLEQAESLFDPVLDRRLILFSRLNRTASLADLGWAGAAVALYRRVEPEFLEQVTERRPHARLRWVGARVAWATENREEAVAIFESLVNDFPDVISACESAIIRLELAAIRLEQGRVPEVRKLAKEILQTFAERGMDHHLRKTLDLAGKAPQA